MAFSVVTVLTRARSIADRLSWAGPLLVRLSLAGVFIFTGWGKLHDLERITGFFTELGIPMPGVNAVVVSALEFVGGLLLLVGLFTRFAALPLAFSMVVAIVTARRGEIEGIASVLAFNEFTYLACFLWLALAGAGAISLDRLLFGRMAGAGPHPALPVSAPATGPSP
ncbi:MAG TPA: DoxX family protein [Myxococcaceae bacterium]|jgi:putative oxidoreductase|nr:DoxX family protein [Myxococcaceae bacterium]